MTTLSEIYSLLREHFGPLTGPGAASPWWPIFGDDPPFEMLVGAVLVQQTRWETVEAATLRLMAAGLLSPPAMAGADPEALAALIRPAAFHAQKAPGLIAIARHIHARYGGSTALLLARPTTELRAELLALPRIGRETCDVAMLYGGGHPVFVVDEYTRRLLERVEVSLERPTPSRWRQPYEVVRQMIEAELSAAHHASLGLHPSSRILHPALYAELHAQINEACVRYCLTRPRCDGPPARRVYSRQAGRESYHGRAEGCPLRPICGYYAGRGKKELR
ncbi:MAG: Fe-S cluster assembly protein HesB [Chloroflexales bacterium]|nr:Fe-S cluster assembly protein HesB [Chloroflexales bacterium]